MKAVSNSSRGYTLVELLVVMGMLAGFMGLIVVGLRTTGGSQAKQLTQLMSASLVSAQSKALASDLGSAVMLGTDQNGTINSVYRADVLPFITGSCTGIPPGDLTLTSVPAASFFPDNTDVSALAAGYKIRFYADRTNGTAPSVWMSFGATGTGNSGTVTFNSAINQTTDNTVWPVAISGKNLDFEIARYPMLAATDFTPPAKAGVDLRFSGIGDGYGEFVGARAPLTFLFNRRGNLETIVASGMAPISPAASLYLLVASLDDIEAGSSLQSETSRWVVIASSTGRVTVSPNVPANDVQSARALARQGATGGSP